jgi:hypothetical protein
VLAAVVLKLPDGQGVQAPPAVLISPAAHAKQLLARPAAEERPAGQSVQAADAVVLKLPDGQGVQAPPAELISPAAHARQSLAEVARPAAEARPAGQSAQSVGALVEPVVALHLPAAQPTAHEVMESAVLEVAVAKRPPGQVVQTPEDKTLEYCPAGQAAHEEPAENLPAGHVMSGYALISPAVMTLKSSTLPSADKR